MCKKICKFFLDYLPAENLQQWIGTEHNILTCFRLHNEQSATCLDEVCLPIPSSREPYPKDYIYQQIIKPRKYMTYRFLLQNGLEGNLLCQPSKSRYQANISHKKVGNYYMLELTNDLIVCCIHFVYVIIQIWYKSQFTKQPLPFQAIVNRICHYKYGYSQTRNGISNQTKRPQTTSETLFPCVP